MTKEQKEHQYIQNKIAEDNKEIKLTEETLDKLPTIFFEVIKEDLGTPNEGNGAGLKCGDLFKASVFLSSSIQNVTSWIIPDHLSYSGLNTIASDLCKEIEEGEYNLKLNSK